MLMVLTGGAATGKSAHAEKLLCERVPEGERIYIATMQPFGEVAERRIRRHHALRASRGFITFERYTDLSGFDLPRPYRGILLECMSNLVANECFSPDGVGFDDAADRILHGIEHLREQCELLVVVTNEIFSDGETYTAETERYIEIIAQINRRLAESADCYAESVCGILLPLKGEELL